MPGWFFFGFHSTFTYAQLTTMTACQNAWLILTGLNMLHKQHALTGRIVHIKCSCCGTKGLYCSNPEAYPGHRGRKPSTPHHLRARFTFRGFLPKCAQSDRLRAAFRYSLRTKCYSTHIHLDPHYGITIFGGIGNQAKLQGIDIASQYCHSGGRGFLLCPTSRAEHHLDI